MLPPAGLSLYLYKSEELGELILPNFIFICSTRFIYIYIYVGALLRYNLQIKISSFKCTYSVCFFFH